MIEVEIDSVRVQPDTQRRYAILRDKAQPTRYLSIWIANAEAYAIAIALPDFQNPPPPRPLTHDLLKNMLEGLDAKVVRVEVTKVIDEVFYAQITLEVAGKQIVFDARPSDAFALAARTHAPIFVEEAVMERAWDQPENEKEE
jgi:bifunctional DNase/RNase